MESIDATPLAALGRYIGEFRALSRQLNTSVIGGRWWKLRVDAAAAAAWANLGYLPEEAAPLIADGITPETVLDAETSAGRPTAAAVIRAMYATNRVRPTMARFALIEQVHLAAARLLGLEHDTSDETFDRISPVGERVVDLMYLAVGITNTGADGTPESMATVGRARDIMARLVDVSDVQVVGPVDERQAAGLVETIPDVD
ncbi:hypothetical protein AB0A95_33425 [Micromonospora sp. NPDC049230]|uniref:hypothetical protein n=1 Tax=Micromonospora sp. NPDC049230 TaxID=3155502 RepID=UPI0033FC8106